MSLGDEHEASGGYGGTGQTRTRLPDTGPDAYGSPRRGPRSSSRSLVTVVGVVILLIAAIAFANRGGGDSSSKDDGSATKPETAATAPSGQRPVKSKSAGIPAGFAQKQEGAESAAANYAVALGSADMFEQAQTARDRGRRLRRPSRRNSAGDLDQAYRTRSFWTTSAWTERRAAPKGRTLRLPGHSGRHQDHGILGANNATVEVWYTSLFGLSGDSSTNPVTETGSP